MCPHHNCVKLVRSVIDLWYKMSKLPLAKLGKTCQISRTPFDELLDIARSPKGCYSAEIANAFLNKELRKLGKTKLAGFEEGVGDQDWTDDMIFYLDQKGPPRRHMEGADGK